MLVTTMGSSPLLSSTVRGSPHPPPPNEMCHLFIFFLNSDHILDFYFLKSRDLLSFFFLNLAASTMMPLRPPTSTFLVPSCYHNDWRMPPHLHQFCAFKQQLVARFCLVLRCLNPLMKGCEGVDHTWASVLSRLD